LQPYRIGRFSRACCSPSDLSLFRFLRVEVFFYVCSQVCSVSEVPHFATYGYCLTPRLVPSPSLLRTRVVSWSLFRAPLLVNLFVLLQRSFKSTVVVGLPLFPFFSLLPPKFVVSAPPFSSSFVPRLSLRMRRRYRLSPPLPIGGRDTVLFRTPYGS